MEPLQIFDNFKLDDLNEQWVDTIWDSQFLTYKNLPDEYVIHLESEDMEVLLKDSYSVIKNWVSEGTNDSESAGQRPEVSWQTLIALNVNPRSLLAVLGYIIGNGQLSGADEDSRQSCLKATSLYFVLIAVPGSNAFHVFHPNLYHKALATFQLSKHLVTKSKKRGRALDLEALYADEDDGDSLRTVEKITLTRGLNSVMFDLIMMLKSFCMRDQIRSLEVTVHELLKVAKLENDTVLFESHVRAKEASLTSLSYNAYMALQGLCDARHGPVDVTVRLIAKYMLPYILFNHGELSNKALATVRDTMICFVKNLLEAHKREARIGIATLIQHLLVKCPDRVDDRQRQAVILIKLINSCKENMYIEAVQDLILLAHHNKVGCRIFAQEIIGKFLAEESLLMTLEMKKLLMATVLGRCVDSSNMVRGKAMATVAECTDLKNNVALITIQEIFESSSRDKPLPSLKLLKQAITENIDPLPGSNTIISLLMARVEDERALVRRSALQTLGNLVSLFSGLLDTVIPALGTHCRDPALTVRRFAIQTLTKLLEQFHDHPMLPDEWVGNVLPQIFDAEVKVTEKVLESLQQLMLDNIAHYSNNNNNPLDNLPWLILNQVTVKKMRKHLSKACNIWERTGVIDDTLVRNIQSHLGTDNNIAAWVLLAAFAENRNLPNLNSHFENYKELVQGETLHASLALEVLRSSWETLDRRLLCTLEPDLFECLSKFQVNFGLISICLDILMEVIKYLHPKNGDQLVELHAIDLMKLSEAHLEKIFESDETEGAASSLYLKAMCTLGNASHLCSRMISSSTLRILQGLLLDWDTLPDALQYIEKLRAAAVALLGQQAMRQRETAQEIMPILGRLMRKKTNSNSNAEVAVSVNAAKALADICVRFTALVEPYLPDMCVSMKDQSPVVREVIVVLFIQLLLEDFIKVKGPFFFHILTMLTDTDDMIRDLTVFLIKERLLVKNKTLISQQFLESIFHYNNYILSGKPGNHKLGDREQVALTLTGQRNQSKRRIIYNFMLDHLEPIGKLKLLNNLTKVVICGVLNNSINVEDDGGSFVLKDTLYILSREQLNPSSCTKSTEDDGQDENIPSLVSPTNNVTNIIIQSIKRQKLEVLLPKLVKLRRKLSEMKSELVTDVARVFLRVVTEYDKDELSNLYNEYPRLENQIECDQREYGKKTLSDDGDDDELEETRTEISNNQTRVLFNENRTPKIVLRRLSSLTYPGICHWRSPSQSSQSGGQSPQPGPSGSQRSLTSPNLVSRLNSPPQLSQPGPSNTTPTSSRSNYLFRSPRYSPIHSSSYNSPRSLRERRVSTILDDTEVMPGYSQTASLDRRVILREIRSSTPNIQEHNPQHDSTGENLRQPQTDSDSD